MSNKNLIKFARSMTRNNLPVSLDYGEPAYVKNAEFIIGNGDGTEFVVNDFNNLTNKPAAANPQFNCITPQTGEILNYLTINNVRACRFDIVCNSSDLSNLRMESIVVVIGASDTISWNSTSTQDIGNTSGIQPVLTASEGSLALGFAITSGSWIWSVVCYPVATAGATPTYTALSL
jgi:hypothetical protein